MATISFTVPDAKLSLILDSIAAQTEWDAGSGITKAQNAKQWLLTKVREVVRIELQNQQHDAGIAEVNAEMNSW